MAESDLRVVGFNDFAQFAASLRAADPKLKAAVRKSIRDSAKPVAVAVILEASKNVPARGGLQARVADANPLVSMIAEGVRVTLRDKKKSNLDALDHGYVRHPVFGQTNVWVKQMTPQTKGTFTDAFLRLAEPGIAPQILQAINDTLKEVGP